MRRSTYGLLLAGAFAGMAATARADEARIAVTTETTSIDPMYHNVSPNIALSRHIFDALMLQDPQLGLHPGLALSWAPVGPSTWEFKLRPGVHFHDGSTLTAADVAFSLDRVGKVAGSPSSLAMYTTAITSVQIVDPLTLRIETNGPSPLLPTNLPFIGIVSRALTEGKRSEDFNSGAVAIGTGPYRFVSWQRGDRVKLTRNPGYWGKAQPWETVTYRAIPNSAARVAALLGGDVDLIDGVPAVDLPKMSTNAEISLFRAEVNVLMYLHLDTARDVSPGVSDAAGTAMTRNPLKDVRVRRAMTMSINRDALANRLLDGEARPAGQFLAPGRFGTSKRTPPAFDAAGAKALMDQAGYPGGFRLTLASTNDRYPRDAEVAQAIAQMWGRIGIRTNVEAMPSSMLFSRGSRLEFSALMSGWVTGTGEPTSPMVALLATYDPERGYGTSNRGRYSNPAFDTLLQQAQRTLDDGQRGAMLASATDMVMDDVGVIPLYTLIKTWGARRGFAYDARADEMSMAMDLRKVAP